MHASRRAGRSLVTERLYGARFRARQAVRASLAVIRPFRANGGAVKSDSHPSFLLVLLCWSGFERSWKETKHVGVFCPILPSFNVRRSGVYYLIVLAN